MFEGVCHNTLLCWIVRLNRGTAAAAVSVDYAGFAEPGSAVIMLASFSW